MEDSPQITLVYGIDRLCCWVSPGFSRIAFRPSSDYLDHPVDAFWADVHPDDLTPARAAWETFWSVSTGDGAHMVPFLLRLRIRSGDYRLAELVGVNRSEGPVGGLVLHLVLVVDRKRAEDLLLSERERLLVTLRSIGDGVITTDMEGRVTLINSVTEGLTGWSQAEALGHPLPEVFRIINEETGAVCENPVERVFETGLVVGLANHTALISKTGQISVIEDSAAPIRDSSGRIIGAVLVFRDVTETKKTAAELLKMQKLESIGVLAGGIAHDFNNILSAILGNASLGAILVEPEHPLQNLLSGIQQAARRASGLTQQLLTFSKGGTPVLESTRVQDLIRQGAEFLLHGTACECRFEFPPDLERIMADPDQLGQVVQNLVLNASQAMRDGGVLMIRGTNVVLSNSGVPPLPDGRYVKLEFIDAGPGITADHLDKIFEPYFTTKPTGSGLGLAVVWSIVKSHGGWVHAQSRLGEGTTFSVWLPATPSMPTPSLQTAADLPLSRKGTALVMDDEADPRKTMAFMLRHLGFECHEAVSGETALTLLEQCGTVDLALVDLTVKGGMGGRELLPLLKTRYPGLRVIVTSGYSIDPVMADHRRFGFDGVLKKPFSLADLTLAVDEALGTS